MFTEYLKGEIWHPLSPMFRFCCFDCAIPQQKAPCTLSPFHAEALFVFQGSVMLFSKTGTSTPLTDNSLFLLSDCSGLRRIDISGHFRGICLSFHARDADEILLRIRSLLGFSPFTLEQVENVFSSLGGYFTLSSHPWLFSSLRTLEGLSPIQQGTYCILKCYELLYLLCNKSDCLQPKHPSPEHQNIVAAEIQRYLLEHISEKISISELSHRFHLSPTACKKCFQLYTGEPIHQWLISKRMTHAAQLLAHSDLSVLQVAQAIGYDGTSQFNAFFKKTFGVSPREYRKKSFSVDSQSIP